MASGQLSRHNHYLRKSSEQRELARKRSRDWYYANKNKVGETMNEHKFTPQISDIVLMSGGIDSTVLLYNILSTLQRDGIAHPHKHVVGLNINYGQRHIVEEQSLKRISGDSGIEVIPVLVPQLSTVLKSALTGKDSQFPTAHDSNEHKGLSVVVPNRNSIFLTIAHGLAQSIGAQRVWIGSHRGDYALFPDCRPRFFILLEKALNTGKTEETQEVRFQFPFVKISKADIISRGISLHVPLEWTWSCYNPVKKNPSLHSSYFIHCGVCLACEERKKAFKDAGISDFTEYKE